MKDKIKIVIDASGGDNAPGEIIKGAVEALNECEKLEYIMAGDEEKINAELAKYTYPKERVEILHCTEEIEMGDPPVSAIRKKKDSSIVKGMHILRDGEADAFLSAGSTGAILVGGQIIVGRIKGVERPPLVPLVPHEHGFSCIVDCGANVDAKPSNLVQFAVMGTLYMKNIMGVENPKVGIVNIGTEEEKGNQLVKDTFPLLKACPDINFVGSVEARDIPKGVVDVIVCDAFVGNVIIKTYEGVASTLVHAIKEGMMSSFTGKIGGALVKKPLKEKLKTFSSDEQGGAPMLGLKALVMKAHGSSDAYAFKHAVLSCVNFVEKDVTGKIQEALSHTDIVS